MHLMRAFAMLCCVAATSALTTLSAEAGGEPMLVIEDRGSGTVTTFEEADLLALPQVAFETSTIWTDGKRQFSGPLLVSVLEAAGVGDGEITLIAINDYSVIIPRDVIDEEAPIVALRKNGAPFGVRDKGPLWVVYPYDSDPELQSEAIYAYSVWQLNRISVAGGD